ncbi:MAG: hypothetical protein JXB45_08475 [Candidatus Krumholzibacteriota bacterium]|nr:hypothetical protein [Candidatus Krumholzibacteriota bacterium]
MGTRSIERAVAFLVLTLMVNCGSPRVELKRKFSESLTETAHVVHIEQDSLLVNIADSPYMPLPSLFEGPSTSLGKALVGEAIEGAIGGIIGGFMEHEMQKYIRGLMAPISYQLKDFDYREKVRDSMAGYHYECAFLDPSLVLARSELDGEKVSALSDSLGLPVVTHQIVYYLGPEFNHIVVRDKISLHLRTDENKFKRIYFNEFFCHECLRDSKKEKENAEYLARNIEVVKRALTNSIRVIPQMFEYDARRSSGGFQERGQLLSIHGTRGTKIKSMDDYLWLRLQADEIYAVKQCR